jgi:hypothetical protein
LNDPFPPVIVPRESKMTESRNEHPKINRRQFLKVTAAGTVGLLAGCRSTAAPSPTPTTAAPTAAPTTAATAAATPVGRPAVIKMFPEIPSTVVHAAHAGVWEGDTLSPVVLRQLLDSSITRLTGLNDARQAWAALFSPAERIAVKVNTFRNSLIWTHVPLVTAVTDSLQDAGIPAENIFLFDYYTNELEKAGFTIRKDGAGVRCYGTEDDYVRGFSAGSTPVQLSRILAESDALINIPVLKSHMIAGLTFAMKNHFGSILSPESMHYPVEEKMAGLNAIAPIKDHTRLVIGDMLEANLRYSDYFPYWKADYKGNSILMSFDPVAHDTVGLQTLSDLLTADGGDPASLVGMAAPCLVSGAALGLGTNDLKNINLVDVNLSR